MCDVWCVEFTLCRGLDVCWVIIVLILCSEILEKSTSTRWRTCSLFYLFDGNSSQWRVIPIEFVVYSKWEKESWWFDAECDIRCDFFEAVRNNFWQIFSCAISWCVFWLQRFVCRPNWKLQHENPFIYWIQFKRQCLFGMFWNEKISKLQRFCIQFKLDRCFLSLRALPKTLHILSLVLSILHTTFDTLHHHTPHTLYPFVVACFVHRVKRFELPVGWQIQRFGRKSCGSMYRCIERQKTLRFMS